MPELIDLYPYRLNDVLPQFFIAERSSDKRYAGQWRMVGGKVQAGEKAWQAALRELNEELDAEPARFWSPPTLNQFYEPSSDNIYHIPVFAAEIDDSAQIQLDDEHTRYKWITIDQAERYIYWPEQLRIMRLIHKILTSKAIIEDWEIPIT